MPTPRLSIAELATITGVSVDAVCLRFAAKIGRQAANATQNTIISPAISAELEADIAEEREAADYQPPHLNPAYFPTADYRFLIPGEVILRGDKVYAVDGALRYTVETGRVGGRYAGDDIVMRPRLPAPPAAPPTTADAAG